MRRATRQEAFAPIGATCMKCGGRMTIYSYPPPNGTAFCHDGCSPAWLGPFLEHASGQGAADATAWPAKSGASPDESSRSSVQ